MLLLGIAWVTLWALIIPPGSPSGDAVPYLTMVTRGPAAAPPPFAFRIGLPGLASLLPLPPAEALRAVSMALLVGTVSVWWALGRRLSIEARWLVLGGLAAASTQGWAGLFAAPWLTDAAGLFFVAAGGAAWLAGRPWLAAALLVAGVPFREAVVGGALPMVLQRSSRAAGIAAVVLGLAVHGWIRSWADMPDGLAPWEAMAGVLLHKGPLRIAGDLIAAFHGLWPIIVLSLASPRAPAERTLLAAGLLTGLGLSLVALNTVRMMSTSALPWVALAVARGAEQVRPRGVPLWLFAGASVAGALTWFPGHAGALPRAAQYVAPLLVLVACALSWRARPRRARGER